MSFTITYDPIQQMALIEIEEKLEAAFDLKNREVRALGLRVDRHLRTIGALERRALMAAQRRRVRK